MVLITVITGAWIVANNMSITGIGLVLDAIGFLFVSWPWFFTSFDALYGQRVSRLENDHYADRERARLVCEMHSRWIGFTFIVWGFLIQIAGLNGVSR